MDAQKRLATWRGWVVAFVAILTMVAIAWGISVAVGVIFPPYPLIVGKSCGTVSAGEGGTDGDFTSVEQCFWDAYKTCQTATIVYQNAGLDATTTHAVSMRKRGESCSVTDDAEGKQDASFGQPARHSYQCSGIEQRAGGLVILGCGEEGDIPIPTSQRQCNDLFWKCA